MIYTLPTIKHPLISPATATASNLSSYKNSVVTMAINSSPPSIKCLHLNNKPNFFNNKNAIFSTSQNNFFKNKNAIFEISKNKNANFAISQNKNAMFAISQNNAAIVSPSVEDSVESSRKLNPIVVIDNYDSFTYNLCQYMGELGCNFVVYRNDELTVDELKKKNPRGILISPGPGAPQDSGISLQTVLELGPTVPLFGVCMGLQCIGEAFGGKIVRSPFGVMHGKKSPVYYNEGEQDGLFSGLSNPFTAGRYHSLVIEKESFPHDLLEITAWTEDGLVMAARHKKFRHIQGVQFHPESIITTEGKTIVSNFIKSIEVFESKSQN